MEDIDIKEVAALLADLIIFLENEAPYSPNLIAFANRAYELRNKING
jgi:hypothetical protein